MTRGFRSPLVRRGDAGLTLLEVVVAMAVFTIVVGAVLGVLIRVLDVTRSNTHRVTAANLATKQIESTRSLRSLDVPDGAVVRTETVGGTTFTVTQTANYVVAGSDTDVCQGTGNQLAYKLVTVEVTWPNMGSVQPVRADTLKALGLGASGLDPRRGSMAVRVSDASGGPVAGVVVRLNPGSLARTTGTDGCAVFVNLGVSTSYTASADQSGYVSSTNTRATQLTQGVQAGRITRATLLYDVARSATIAWQPPPGHAPPAGLPVRYRSSHVSAGSVLPTCPTSGNACVTGVPGTLQHLFPAVYDVNAGSCLDARPGSDDVDLRPGNGAVAVPLSGYTVQVLSVQNRPLAGRTVTATHSGDGATGCASGESYQMTTDATGQARMALPRGRWTFSSPGTASVTVVNAGGTTPVLLVGGGGGGGGGCSSSGSGNNCDDDDDD